MKIYTRTGDDGKTSLLTGQRVDKSDPRIDCCGTVDELNAALGLAAPAPGADRLGPIIDLVRSVQNDLFTIGSYLAVPDDAATPSALPPLDSAMIMRLENEIDAAEAQLPPLRNFILPGGGELAARLHLARAICRRAERQVVHLSADHSVSPTILIYLNRLSDWLFVQARLANHLAGIPDIPWRAK